MSNFLVAELQGIEARQSHDIHRHTFKISLTTTLNPSPQTVALLDMLQLPYNLDHAEAAAAYSHGPSSSGGRGMGRGGGMRYMPAQGAPPPPPSVNPEV